MPRTPTGDPHAALAVQIFDEVMAANGWGLDRAWLAIAKLLLTCQVWRDGVWRNLPGMEQGAPLLMESNNYKLTNSKTPNSYMRDAIRVQGYIAAELGVPPADLCDELGIYFKQPGVAHLQPNNIRGHAFRSLVAHALATFGDQNLNVVEEYSARELFPGWRLDTRSQQSKVDIAVFRGERLVAMVSARWTYRHDRVDMLDEAHAYVPPARRMNPRAGFYGVTGEFGVARLAKVVAQSEPVQQYGIIRRLVHLHVPLATTVLEHNHTLSHMMDLQGFVNDSFNWE